MSFLRVLVFIVFGLEFTWSQYDNNVCRTIEDYFNNITQNNNCWYDSDLKADPEQIAKNHGFLLEKHIIKTDDKYVLTTFQIKSKSGLYGNKVIFLQHGLGAEAECFMGYGNKSLDTHTNLFEVDKHVAKCFNTLDLVRVYLVFSQNNPYSFSADTNVASIFSCTSTECDLKTYHIHEHGMYDLAANFKYVFGKTKKKIIYLGHSMGGTGFGIYASIKPNEAKKYVNHAVLLAPAFYLPTTKGLVNANNVLSFYHAMKLVDMVTPINVLLEPNSIEKQALNYFCFLSLENLQICIKFFEELLGNTEKQIIDPEKLPLGLKLFRNLGLKDFFHLAQIVEHNGEFIMYDYDAAENLVRYNSLVPPSYNLSRITVPLTWIYGENDNIATKSDIMYAFNMFQKQDIYGLPYGHVLFFFDKNADKIAYPTLLKAINKFK